MHDVCLVGYSGHSYVVGEILKSAGHIIYGYCEKKPLLKNPLNLEYLGYEQDQSTINRILDAGLRYFVAIGDNSSRQNISIYLNTHSINTLNAIHPTSSLSPLAKLGVGIMIGPGARINALAIISEGSIVNTGAIIEHECRIGKYCHIAPGAVLAGGVSIGDRTLVGANAVVKDWIKIGSDVVIGTGAVVVKDIPDNQVVVGNPAKSIR